MIRDATETDIPRLVEMGTRFLTETVYRGKVLVNPQAIARTMGLLVASDSGALFVSEVDGVVTGMIGLLVYEHPFTGARVASELFWWTEVEARGHGLRLLQHGEQWAQTMGAATLHMIAPVGSAIGRLYQRYGYQELESTWQRTFAYATEGVA